MYTYKQLRLSKKSVTLKILSNQLCHMYYTHM